MRFKGIKKFFPLYSIDIMRVKFIRRDTLIYTCIHIYRICIYVYKWRLHFYVL